MVKEMCGEQLKERKRSMDLLLMLGLSETMNQFTMANSVHAVGQKREDGHVLKGHKTLRLKVKGKK